MRNDQMKEPWENELDKHDGDNGRAEDIMRLLHEAQISLIAAAVGSCTCLTKSPNLAHHNADCRYLKISNVLEALESVRAIVPEEWKVYGPRK